MEVNSSRIGVFDSGMGGLDIAAAISRHLSQEDIVYFGDNARVPYGTKSASVVKSYTYEAADRLAQQGIKALVIACNTASAVVDFAHLESVLGVPVFGMIEAGISACNALLQDRAEYLTHVAILATPGTIRSEAYQSALASAYPKLKIAAIPCPLFVPLVEMGWEEHELSRVLVKAQLQEHYEKFKALVDRHGNEEALYLLGCTHYPMMQEAILGGISLLDRGVFHCLDGAESVALLLKARLEREGLLRPAPPQQIGKRIAYFSDDPHRPSAAELASRFWKRRGGVGEMIIKHAESRE